jgi:HK97 family phage major capsid protein
MKMNLEQMKARLAEIISKLGEFQAIENFSAEDVNEINELNAEFEGLKTNIEAKEKVASMTAQSTTSARKTTPDTRIEVKATQTEKNGGFKNFGEFLGAVKSASNGSIDKRFQNTMFERNGEDGGFLVPEEMMSEVTKKCQSDESLLAKTRQLVVSGNALSLPVDESQPWNGGVNAYWVAEGAAITASGSGKIGLANWKLHKLAALVKVTDELLEDATALESYMKAMAPEAIMHKINGAILSGDGVGKPIGILNSGFKYKVLKESGQSADTIVAKNVLKMYSRMIPGSRAKAAWYINAGCEEQLRLMKDDVGNFIYVAPGSQLNQTPYGMLLGLPVIPLIGSMPALGDEGDIILADLSYYYTIQKAGGMKQAVSSHLYFDRDISAYKFTLRIDGACPFKTPVVTEFGSHSMSGIITLEAR